MTEEELPRTVVRRGFVPVVSARSVRMEHAGAGMVVANGGASFANAGAHTVLANGAVDIANGGAQFILANGRVDVQQGGALAVVGRQVEVRGGSLGIALAPQVTLADSKVLLGPREALLLGLGLAIGGGLVAGVLRRAR